VYCEIAGLPAELVQQVRGRYSGGEFQEAARAAEALPDDFVHRMALAGGSAQARQHIRNLAGLGIESITVFPLGARRMHTVELFQECVAAETGSRV
jgi:5,10-methylenetetrahydromethanopterin reductase